MVFSKPTVNYLAVMIDAKLSLYVSLECACQMTARATVELAKILPNIGGTYDTFWLTDEGACKLIRDGSM